MIARRTFFMLAAATIAVSSVAACASRSNSVTGTVSYRERLILPADSVIVTRLEDISRGQSYPAVVAEQRIVPNSMAVTSFSLPYDRGSINPNATYVVNAWIEQGGRVLFRNNKVYQVLTKTAPMGNIHVELEQVAAVFVPQPVTTVQPAPGTVVQQTTTTTTTPSGAVLVQPAPTPGTYVVQPAPAAPPAGTVILQPVR
ncbi:MAG: YbaY family lipoprotein [Ferrovibrio sp.]|uniref:YbaY family lipoprotein n=1 Tax=Ferrovibrio sp. TaxID=1917215 RepID=UPI00261EFED9|nr:YbaY family lipoprotein [Ferrovibrio sp.]MCW0234602.1 YbaY family lipoprotein [Ferrovibrio sp.]